MSHWKLGHAEKARATLAQARVAMGNPSLSVDECNPSHLVEAKLLITSASELSEKQEAIGGSQ